MCNFKVCNFALNMSLPLGILRKQDIEKTETTGSHLDGVDESHEPQAAEVDIESVTERPDQIVAGWILARVAHVDRGRAARLTAGLTVSKRSAVVHVAVCGVIHPRRSGVNSCGRI